MGARVYFTSDLHFDHYNFTEFRGGIHGTYFTDVEDMNLWIVANHNHVVRKKDDIVWILGDVSWTEHGLEYLKLMNGRKRLILGNHDTEKSNFQIDKYLPYFEQIHGVSKKYGMVMTHVPIHEQELAYRWKINVHGHIHHKERCIEDPRYINVNIDVRRGFPTSLEDIREEVKANGV